MQQVSWGLAWPAWAFQCILPACSRQRTGQPGVWEACDGVSSPVIITAELEGWKEGMERRSRSHYTNIAWSVCDGQIPEGRGWEECASPHPVGLHTAVLKWRILEAEGKDGFCGQMNSWQLFKIESSGKVLSILWLGSGKMNHSILTEGNHIQGLN